MSALNLVNLIEQQQPLSCSRCLAAYIRLHPARANLKAGVYQFESDLNPSKLISKVVNGEVLEQQLTITEGQTSHSVLDTLNRLPYIQKASYQEIKKNLNLTTYQQEIEGAFLAETYFFPAGSKVVDVLQRSHQALIDALNHIWQNRQKNLPYQTPWQLLTAASIIEKEAANSQEKFLISAVIINRLSKNMRLQMDPTVIYALAEQYHYPLKKKDLKVASPYNTYRHKGLPPAPIANVGFETLYAAAHPAAVDYLYFVATNEGLHHFSKTLLEQTRMIQKIRQHR